MRKYEKRLGLIGMGISNCAVVKGAVGLYDVILTYDSKVIGIDNSLCTVDQVDVMCISPGIDVLKTTDVKIRELASHCDVVNDIELWFRHFGGEKPYVIAVTGSFGKSTTVMRIAEMVRRLGLTVDCVGNIGRPIWECDRLVDVMVLEVSSAQLERIVAMRANIGVVLNVYKHHLERHGTIDEYRCVKRRICAMSDVVFVHEDLHEEFGGIVIGDLYKQIRDMLMIWFDIKDGRGGDGGERGGDEGERGSGRDVESLVKLKYRLERIGSNVINDSKSTSPLTTQFALEYVLKEMREGCEWYGRKVMLICGGKLNTTVDWNVDWSQVYAVVLFGEGRFFIRGFCTVENCVLIESLRDLDIGEYCCDDRYVVLFSPGCQSMSEFKDFEERGRVFEGICGGESKWM